MLPNGLRLVPDRGYLRWGGDGEAVQPACPGRTVQGKMTRLRKLLEIAARRRRRQSPVSGARFVGWRLEEHD